MSSISSIPGQTINSLFNTQNNNSTSSSGAHGANSKDPASGVAGQGGVVPPIVAMLQNIIHELESTALAPASGAGGEAKAHGHHHGGGGGSKTDSATTGSTGGAAGKTSSAEQTSEQLANASELISQLWNSTDGTINQLAKIVIMEAADESRESQQEAQEDTDAAKASLMDQASTLNKEADEMRAGAAVSLVMTVVSSAIQIGFATYTLSATKDSMDKISSIGKNATDSEENKAIQEAQNIGNKASAWGQVGQALSGVTSGLGNFASTMYQADAKDTEAEGDVDAAQAQDLQSRSTAAQKIADDMNKLVDQITDMLKEMADADAQMMQSMTRV